MFNVLISGNDAAWESEQRMQMAIDRFLECSGDEAQKIKPEDPRTLKLLERVPALLMYEVLIKDPPGEVVRVGQLRDIRVQGEVSAFDSRERAH